MTMDGSAFQPTRRDAADMVAGDLMTKLVISVDEDATVREVAARLLESHVGALRVTDSTGKPLGMVSDGDLLGRRAAEVRQDWWLDLLASTAPAIGLSDAARSRPVRDVMTTPLISVSPYTSVREVVRLLQTHRIKRIPIVFDDKLVGIISRSDVLTLITHLPKSAAEGAGTAGGLYGLLQSLAGGAGHAVASTTQASPGTPETTQDISASSFRKLVTASEQAKIDEAAGTKRAMETERKKTGHSGARTVRDR